MDSLGIGIGTELLDWTVSEPESESKKMEPGTPGLKGVVHDIIWGFKNPLGILVFWFDTTKSVLSRSNGVPTQ